MLVKFYSEGQLVFGDLSLPYEGAPGVIVLHGLESSKDSDKWVAITQMLTKNGYACLRFSFRGCGDGQEKSEGCFEDTTLTARIEDYRSAIRFLEDANVDSEKIAAIGSSFGGMVAIAAQERRVKVLVTLATPYKIPRYDMPLIPQLKGDYYVLPSGRRLKKHFYSDLKQHDLLEAITNTSSILIIHGSSDEIVPLDHSRALYQHASEPKRLVIIPGADHTFSNKEHLNKVMELSLEWLRNYL